ncbi:hypothetical protein [Gillisia limnaea]|uniref:HNH endonuclease n=1 Tax=Gillisia limnaea (strain DSM 15749 / LMG 21470 / R-8282) TaxID=865937 RepID=H2BVR5_GILLR|nr:hypothetical protein [Gillisia limnaea]EHQ04021.1 hypothetical protein Gilli_3421 [Gillisia limnaea DSM 15749]
MIRVKIDNLKVEEYFKKINTSFGKYKSVCKKIKNKERSPTHSTNLVVLWEIKNQLKEILTGTPSNLERIIKDFENKGYQDTIYDSTTEKLTHFGVELKTIFDYKNFRNSQKALWLGETLNCRSCTSCNTQFTLVTSQAKGDKLLFHLDHYFPQSVYPYLSLSIFNLIPCCSSCNMSKSNKPFKLDSHIHPYLDGLNEIGKFKIDKYSLVKFLIDPEKNEEKIEYKLKIREKFSGDTRIEKKLANYKTEFRIDEQYKQFKDVVAEMHLKSKFYNTERRVELKEFFEESSINITDELINRFILGNYVSDDDLLKRPLAKFMKDIGEDINLIPKNP